MDSTAKTYGDNGTKNLNHGGYGSVLFDPRWKSRRWEILERDGYKCIICGAGEELEVHHRQYHFSTIKNVLSDPWDYADRILITLCRSCHQNGHRLFKVPTKKIN